MCRNTKIVSFLKKLYLGIYTIAKQTSFDVVLSVPTLHPIPKTLSLLMVKLNLLMSVLNRLIVVKLILYFPFI